MYSPFLFEELFLVHHRNPDGKKFEKVDRYVCEGVTYKVDLIIDINCELFKLNIGQKISVGITNTLHKDGTPSPETYEPDDSPSFLDDYHYVMYGRVFKLLPHPSNQLEVFASFGGLLMSLKGDARQINSFELDNNIYLLIKTIDES